MSEGTEFFAARLRRDAKKLGIRLPATKESETMDYDEKIEANRAALAKARAAKAAKAAAAIEQPHDPARIEAMKTGKLTALARRLLADRSWLPKLEVDEIAQLGAACAEELPARKAREIEAIQAEVARLKQRLAELEGASA